MYNSKQSTDILYPNTARLFYHTNFSVYYITYSYWLWWKSWLLFYSSSSLLLRTRNKSTWTHKK